MTPQSIDRYQVKGELGRGGMATVYQAHDPLFERTVAIKVMPPQFSQDAEFRARFIREARAVAALEHPAIVPVYDYGEDYNQPYLVMRYMPGGSLANRLGEGALPLEETAVIIRRLAAALDAAHQIGIIHRDLKPSNILFDQYGEAYLADFGIVRVADSDEALTATGSLMGTPYYMSPEQVQGDVVLDGRSDLYALGVILFQMLTGDVPYRADTPAKTMMRHILDPVPRLLDQRPDLPAAFDDIITKALAKERDDRFPTGAELVTALNQAIQEQSTETTAIAPSAPTPASEAAPESESPPPPQPEPEPAQKPQVQRAKPQSQPPAPQTTSQPDKETRRLAPIFWAGVGVLGLICLAITGGVAWLALQSNPVEEAVVVGEEEPGLPPPGEPTVDPAVSVVAALALTREQQSVDATAAAAAPATETETAVPPTTPPEPDATRDSALATRESLAATATADAAADQPVTSAAPLTSDMRLLYGPVDGEIVHDDDELLESSFAEVAPDDFLLQAAFGVPYTAETGGWDIGVTFRQVAADREMRLVIRSDGAWNLNDRRSGDDFVAEGDVSGLINLDTSERNEVMLLAAGERGYFFLNDSFVAPLDLSGRTEAGDLALGTAFYGSQEFAGETVPFYDFTVWSGTPLAGPMDGRLEHVDDGFIKTAYADVPPQTNFITEVTFTNPYPAEEGGWDVGFVFREADDGNQFWLIVEENGEWSLIDRQDEEDVFINEGSITNVNAGAGEQNHLTLVTLGENGRFLVNGETAGELDLSSRPHSGALGVVTAFFIGNEIPGEVTLYDGFTIWSLP